MSPALSPTETSPVILILFAWAAISTGLFLRVLGDAMARWRAEHDATFWRDQTRLEHERGECLQRAADDWRTRADDWFYRTRVAHARRKRLQKVADRLFARIALDSIEGALLRGEIDSRDEKTKDSGRLLLTTANYLAESEKIRGELAAELVRAQTEANRLEIDLENLQTHAGHLRNQQIVLVSDLDLFKSLHVKVSAERDDFRATMEAYKTERDEARDTVAIVTYERDTVLGKLAELRKPKIKKGKRS